jgi:hypothetical protein
MYKIAILFAHTEGGNCELLRIDCELPGSQWFHDDLMRFLEQQEDQDNFANHQSGKILLFHGTYRRSKTGADFKGTIKEVLPYNSIDYPYDPPSDG